MAGRYLARNETPAQRAHRYNVWLRYYGVWYTTDEFKRRFGDSSSVTAAELQLLNPLAALAVGRAMISQMVMDSKPPAEIISALERQNAFEDKIRANFYEPIPNQQDKVPWPTVEEYVAIGERRGERIDQAGEIVMTRLT